jgi:DNA-binding beta-propeller fold protein YncE
MALNPKGSLLVVSVALGAIALGWSGGSAISARTSNIGSDRIVSFEALPDPNGSVCVMPGAESASLPAAILAMESLPRLPTAASTALAAAPAQEVSAGAGTAYQARTRAGQINKKPSRYIKDPWPAWSAVAVNPEHDIVVVTDENLFRIVEYSRLDNTSPTAQLTQPHRVIGGPDSKTEMMCGAYIDPQTLDIYVTNNDTQNWLPVFSLESRGNAQPDRMLMTPHRTWGIAADEQRQELYLTVQDPPLVIVYRKQAANNEAPLRLFEGDATELADPHGIALDLKRDLVIVANHGHRRFYGGPAVSTSRQAWEQWISRTDDLNSPPRQRLLGLGQFDLPSITIYQRGVSGNTPPLRIIKGPKTQLNWPSHVAVHEERGEIFVANDADDSILVFRITDSGDVAPLRTIKGPRTRVKNPTGLTVDPRNNEIWVASMGNYAVTVFPITADGDVAPLRTIRGGPSDREALMIGNPGAVGYDNKRQEILVPN